MPIHARLHREWVGVEQFATHPCTPPSIPHIPEATSGACGMDIGETTVELVNSCSRMMDLLDAPRDISFFSKLIQREIIYRLLQGNQGARRSRSGEFQGKCLTIRQTENGIRLQIARQRGPRRR